MRLPPATLQPGNPILQEKTPAARLTLARMGFLLIFGALALVALYWHLGRPDEYYHDLRQRTNIQATRNLPALRGSLLDRKGRPVAISVPAINIYARQAHFFPAQASPRQLDMTDNLRQLAALLDMPPADLARRLETPTRSGEISLKRRADFALGAKIDALGIPGVLWYRQDRRHYAMGEAGAHLLGTLHVDGYGMDGMERVFDDILSGFAGQREVTLDRTRKVVDSREKPPHNGQDVPLSIDRNLQLQAHEILARHARENKAQAGSVVVLDARSGALLALANYPAFDPASGATASPEARNNRALRAMFDPGSVMKPFGLALALERGLITPQTVVDTSPGRITVGKAPPITDGQHNYGRLDIAGVLQKSSNVGTVKIGMRLENQDLWQMYRRLGFGQRPDIALDKTGPMGLAKLSALYHEREYVMNLGERGRMAWLRKRLGAPPPPEKTPGQATSDGAPDGGSATSTVTSAVDRQMERWRQQHATRLRALQEQPELPLALGFPGAEKGLLHHHSIWRDVDKSRMLYGYSLSLTMMQIARAYTVFANDGRLLPLRLTQEPGGAGGQDGQEQIFSPRVARTMRQMLGQVVDQPGSHARVPGYSVGGKSGTARKLVNGAYVPDKHRALFVGMAPLDTPRVIVAVMLDEPRAGKYYGGAVAAPMFSEIMHSALHLLDVPPDRSLTAQSPP